VSALLNPKREAFAREIARGENASQAYVKAGYQACRQNASRMMTYDDIKQRVAEIEKEAKTNSKAGRDEETGRFLPGNSGNGGRKPGSRNKLGEQFIADLHAEWQQSGATALKRMAENDPVSFVKVTASILPKEIDATLSIEAEWLKELTDFRVAWDWAAKVIGLSDDERADKLIELQAEEPVDG